MIKFVVVFGFVLYFGLEKFQFGLTLLSLTAWIWFCVFLTWLLQPNLIHPRQSESKPNKHHTMFFKLSISVFEFQLELKKLDSEMRHKERFHIHDQRIMLINQLSQKRIDSQKGTVRWYLLIFESESHFLDENQARTALEDCLDFAVHYTGVGHEPQRQIAGRTKKHARNNNL